MKRVNLSIEINTLKLNSEILEFVYRIENTGSVTLCEDFFICSKIFKRISCLPQYLLSPGDTLEIKKTFKITEEYSEGLLEEQATVYFQSFSSNIAKKSISEFGFSLIAYAAYSWLVESNVYQVIIYYINESNFEGKDVYLKFIHSDNLIVSSTFETSHRIPVNRYVNDKGEAIFHFPKFPIGVETSIGVTVLINKPGSFSIGADITSPNHVVREKMNGRLKQILTTQM